MNVLMNVYKIFRNTMLIFIVFSYLHGYEKLYGYEKVVNKEVFTLDSILLASGEELKNIEIGYETYGTLSKNKDNVILICHYYSGTSHAAGRYSVNDKLYGWWDKIIGKGKAVDTDKYFVIASDTLLNINVYDENVITTGPASINPQTDKPYGLTFPIIEFRDIINVQYELLKSLGIKHLIAVMGPSMGGIQTWQWAVSYPNFMDKIIPVIATPKADGWLIGWLNLWSRPILIDPKWNNGNYYFGKKPVNGTALSLQIVSMSANGSGWANSTFGRKWANPIQAPEDSLFNLFAIEKSLIDTSLYSAANIVDANSMLYLNKANALFDISKDFHSMEDALRSIKADILIINSKTDILFTQDEFINYLNIFKEINKPVSHFEINSSFGHLGGLYDIEQAGQSIKVFLDN